MRKVLPLLLAVTCVACRTPEVREGDAERLLFAQLAEREISLQSLTEDGLRSLYLFVEANPDLEVVRANPRTAAAVRDRYEGLFPKAAAARRERAERESLLREIENLSGRQERIEYIGRLQPETVAALYEHLRENGSGDEGAADAGTAGLIAGAYENISIGNAEEAVPALEDEFSRLRYADDRREFLASIDLERLEMLERHVRSKTLYAREKEEYLALIRRARLERLVRNEYPDAYRKYLLLTMMPEREQRIAALSSLDEETREELEAFMRSEWFRAYGESAYIAEVREAREAAARTRAAEAGGGQAPEEGTPAAVTDGAEAERTAEEERLGAEREARERETQERIAAARTLPPLFRDIPWESSPRQALLMEDRLGVTLDFVAEERLVPERLSVESYFADAPMDAFGYKASVEYRFWLNRFFEGRYWILAPARAAPGHYAAVIDDIREQLTAEYGTPVRRDMAETVWEFDYARIVLAFVVDRGVESVQVRYAWSRTYSAVAESYEAYHIGKEY